MPIKAKALKDISKQVDALLNSLITYIPSAVTCDSNSCPFLPESEQQYEIELLA